MLQRISSPAPACHEIKYRGYVLLLKHNVIQCLTTLRQVYCTQEEIAFVCRFVDRKAPIRLGAHEITLWNRVRYRCKSNAIVCPIAEVEDTKGTFQWRE